MERPIESVEIVSDGILVRFSDGLLTYFSHDFLRDHIGIGSNQVFLDHNPAPDSGVLAGLPGRLHPVM